MSDKPKQCGDCQHWHQNPTDPNNLASGRSPNRQGQCREGPPHLTMIPVGNGIASLVGYPGPLVETFTACDRWSQRLPTFDVGEEVLCTKPGSWIDGRTGIIVELTPDRKVAAMYDRCVGYPVQLDEGEFTFIEPQYLERVDSK